MASYGRQVLASVGRDVQVSADGRPDWKIGGITLDWSLVAAVSADTTLLDDTVVPNGAKFLRFGQIVCRVTTIEQQTITLTSATGGTFTITLSGQTTSALAYNASAATVQAALEALSNVGIGNVTVTGAAGGPYTVNFSPSLGNLATMTTTDSTTGSGHSIAVASVTDAASNVGKFGPYDPTASDGRQTLTRGDCYILNRTVLQNVPVGVGSTASDHPAVFDGGQAWKARVLMTTGAHSLAVGPTVAEVNTAFPRLAYAQN